MRLSEKEGKIVAAVSFFPFGAILHNAIFKPHTCMLNYLEGVDYYPSVVGRWLVSDPSPWLAALAAFIAYFVTRRKPALRPWLAAFVVAFLPLCLWVWDIPATGRVICHVLHDRRTFLTSRHFYLLGALLFVPLGYLFARRAGAEADQGHAPEKIHAA